MTSEPQAEDCIICHDVLKDPVTLPCNHKYCAACLEGWRSKYDTGSGRTCPTCRGKIPPTKEMIAQLNTLKHLRQRGRESLESEEPLVAETALIPEDMELMIQSLPPEKRDAAIRTIVAAQVENFDEQIKEMEATYGDFDTTIDQGLGPNEIALPMEICDAAGRGDTLIVLSWLGDPPIAKERINAKNPDKMHRTLLHEAEFENRIGLMSVLLQLGADVDARSSFGTTPLGQACSIPRLEDAARLLLEWGASISEATTDSSPLDRTVEIYTGNAKLARLLRTPLGGRRCEIVNLVEKPDLNGMTGIAFQYMPKKDRYAVKLERTQKLISVKPENLRRRDRTMDDPGVYFTYGQNERGEYGYTRGLCFDSKEDADAYQNSQREK